MRFSAMQSGPKIPTAIIGTLSKTLPDYFTHADLDSMFLMAGAPEPIPDGSKAAKVKAWLRKINVECAEPLKILGLILDEFMELQVQDQDFWSGETDNVAKVETSKERVKEMLAKDGLSFIRGGTISKGGALPTLSLDESVRKHGLSSVDVEIKRAVAMIEKDPHAAAQYAGNVLEATLKAYLDHKQVAYGRGDALAELWKTASAQIGLRASDLDSKDLKKIASGLHGIVDGIAHLRNTKSGAHGRSEEQRQNINIKPRHARLAIHSAHTIAAYVLELIE
ncbi:abortive infection family protein [Rhodobacter sp. JA431]|uniref:abortive infection family protein n=1 Tax=Rhodobacter sp. JA431 TaxID=570013 RepID=UPI0020166624|nr:abortive infection family protein [Rhodobacter sp. JA431]